jgi:hypothetical protein
MQAMKLGMLPRKSCGVVGGRGGPGGSPLNSPAVGRSAPAKGRHNLASLTVGPASWRAPALHFAQTAGSVAPSTHPSAGRFTGMAIASLARAGFRPGVHFRDDPSRAAPAAFQPSPLPIDLEFVRVVLCISYVRM